MCQFQKRRYSPLNYDLSLVRLGRGECRYAAARVALDLWVLGVEEDDERGEGTSTYNGDLILGYLKKKTF